jgi:hypothetical protein
MKKLIIVLMLLTASGSLHAQTWAEWFKQKKTQKKYLLQQIAALKVYIDYAQKGYKIAEQGLNTIGGWTKGEFDLHGDYFNSLKNVTPEIKNYYKVPEVISLQIKIVQQYNKINTQVNQSENLTQAEKDYITRVFERLLADCESTLDELITVTTNGKLEMEDSQRMARIDKLYLDMKDRYTFCNSFSSDSRLVAASRKHEKSSIANSRAMNGIDNPQP